MASFNRVFGGAIWTNHALDRLRDRGLDQNMAGQAFNHPDRAFPGKQAGTTEYQKRFGNSLVTLIGKQNERNEWLILSAWIDPPLPGSIDFYKRQQWDRYKKAGFWGKMWITLLKQIGL